MTQNVETISKITVKDVVGVGGDALAPRIGEVIMAVKGVITGFFEKAAQFGPTIGFEGSFVAFDTATGKYFSASKMYMPTSDSAKTVVNKLEAVKGDLEIGYEVLVAKPSPKASTKVAFTVRQISTVERASRDAELLASLQSGVKALPAPEKVDSKKKSA